MGMSEACVQTNIEGKTDISDELLLEALIAGGDERTELDPVTGRNRYFANPV
ncbi:MAG: hypothetical protein ACI9CV_000773, partial [Ilumatobacter sp.]